jgi:hypothetical protein
MACFFLVFQILCKFYPFLLITGFSCILIVYLDGPTLFNYIELLIKKVYNLSVKKRRCNVVCKSVLEVRRGV